MIKGNRRYFIAVLVMVGIVLCVFVYCSLRNTNVAEPEYVFVYADNQADDYPTTLGAKYFAKLVEERTDGRIRILVRSEGIMGTEQEVISQLQYGGIDFARVSLSHIAEYIPEMNVLCVPYLYTDSTHMWKVLDGEIGDEFLALTEKEDMIGLSWYDAGARNFYNTQKPVTCLEDMAGMKIRVQESKMMVDTIEALGAQAIQADYAEVYSGLELGYIQGAENNWSSYESMQHYKVAKYLTVDEHTRIPEIQLCSRHTWEILEEDDRKIIAGCAEESALYERKLWKEHEEEARKTAIRKGTEVVELSAEEKHRFQEAVQPIYEKYGGDNIDIINQIIELGN